MFAWLLTIGFLAAQPPGTVAHIDTLLRFRVSTPPATLDWHVAHTSHEAPFLVNLMEGLTEHDRGLTPQPRLAESWDISTDGLAYRFKLRKNVLWSDGVPLTAQHFVDSWARLRDPKTKSEYAHYLDDVASAVAENPQTLVVKLKRPVPYFLHLPTFWATFPIRKDLIAKDPAGWHDPMSLVTLGPYTATRRTSAKFFRLIKNPTYWDAHQGPDAVELLMEPSEERVRGFFALGAVDLLFNATTADLLKAQEAGRRIEQYPYLGTFYLGFNVAKGPTKNLSLRKALALGIERAAIPEQLKGGHQAADSWLPPSMPGRATQNAVSGTLVDARRHLHESKHRASQALRIVFEWTEATRGVASLIQGQWDERLGLKTTLVGLEGPEYRRALARGDFDIYLGHWGADFPDPSNFFQVFGSKSPSNTTGWKNARYDSLLERARGNLALADRMPMYYEAESLLTQVDVAILPLFYKKTAVILNSSIQTMEISPLNYFFFKSVRMK